MLSEERVLDAMRHIIDPDLGKDIVSLGFIKNLTIAGGEVSFTVELTTPACPVKEEFRQKCADAVGALEGVQSVKVEMGAQAPRKREAEGPNTLTSVDTIIAVSSCKGGVGKSTVAAQLAVAMQREGLATGLLDADVYGPSMPTMFGLHNPTVYGNSEGLIVPLEAEGLKLMSMGFLLGENPAVLRGPIVSNYIQQILRQTDWGKLDYLIIDMPPGTGDIQLTIVQQAQLDGAVIVTTPQALSLVDVARGILMFDKVNVPVLGVVENMSWFEDEESGKRYYPFGHSEQSIQKRFGLPTLVELPITPGISEITNHQLRARSAAFDTLAENVHRNIGISRMSGQTQPEVEATPEGLKVTFQDGKTALYSLFDLRCACPCARCVDEYTGERLLDPGQISDDVNIEGMRELGNYAISFAWSDGHSTGIYSWEYLRELAENQVGVA